MSQVESIGDSGMDSLTSSRPADLADLGGGGVSLTSVTAIGSAPQSPGAVRHTSIAEGTSTAQGIITTTIPNSPIGN